MYIAAVLRGPLQPSVSKPIYKGYLGCTSVEKNPRSFCSLNSKRWPGQSLHKIAFFRRALPLSLPVKAFSFLETIRANHFASIKLRTPSCSLIRSLRRQLGGCLLGEYSLKLCTSLRRVFFTGRYQLPEEWQICLPFPQNCGSFLAARFFLLKHINK